MSKPTDQPKVHGIGGVFFRSRDPNATRQWYAEHLGLGVDQYGTNFAWRQADDPSQAGYTQWSPFSAETEYFGSEQQEFMINYRVSNLESLIEKLRTQGIEIVGEITQEPYGKFAHIVDGDGRRVELWEPHDGEYEKMLDGITK